MFSCFEPQLPRFTVQQDTSWPPNVKLPVSPDPPSTRPGSTTVALSPPSPSPMILRYVTRRGPRFVVCLYSSSLNQSQLVLFLLRFSLDFCPHRYHFSLQKTCRKCILNLNNCNLFQLVDHVVRKSTNLPNF